MSYAKDFLFPVTVSVAVSLGTKLAQLRVSVGMHIDLTDHSSDAFALAQVAPQKQICI